MVMRRTIALLAVGISLTLTASGAAALPQWLVFSAIDPNTQSNQLFEIQPTGDGLKQLTTGHLPAVAPAFSPNGSRIAFSRTGSGLFVMNTDGSGLKRLTSGIRDSFPAWSPDGTRIAFIRVVGPEWRIYVMSATGGPQRRLTKAPAAGRPSWTKAGLLIPSVGDLLRIDPATGKIEKYYGANIDIVSGLNSVAVSPDSSTITFVGSRPPNPGDQDCGDGAPCPKFALYSQKLHPLGKVKKVLNDAGPASFSPDGKSIVYVAKNALVIQTLATGSTTTVSTGTAFPSVPAPPAWSPR